MAYIIGYDLVLGEGLKSLVRNAVTVLNGKEYIYNIYIVHGSGRKVDSLYYEHDAVLYVCGVKMDINVQWISNPYYIDKKHYIESRDVDLFVKDIIRFVIRPEEKRKKEIHNKKHSHGKQQADIRKHLQKDQG